MPITMIGANTLRPTTETALVPDVTTMTSEEVGLRYGGSFDPGVWRH